MDERRTPTVLTVGATWLQPLLVARGADVSTWELHRERPFARLLCGEVADATVLDLRAELEARLDLLTWLRSHPRWQRSLVVALGDPAPRSQRDRGRVDLWVGDEDQLARILPGLLRRLRLPAPRPAHSASSPGRSAVTGATAKTARPVAIRRPSRVVTRALAWPTIRPAWVTSAAATSAPPATGAGRR